MNAFTIAAFDPSGSAVGTLQRRFDTLSSKWTSIAAEYLKAHGSVFNEPWAGALSHLHTRFTSTAGTALVVFSVRGIPVASIALLSGQRQGAESSLLQMFVESLRATPLVEMYAESGAPFRGMLEVAARPLMLVVPWGDERVTEQDQELVRELSLHLAGAFFSALTVPALVRSEKEPARLTGSEISEVEECVQAWQENRLTQAGVLEALFNLRTLDQQLLLLSKLPPSFADEAKKEVAHAPASVDELLPGAHIPRSVPQSKEQAAELAQRHGHYWAERIQRMHELHAYFLQ